MAPLPNPKAAKTGSSRTFSSTATADCEANRCRCSVCRTLCSTLYPVLKVMPATPKKQIQRFQALPFDFLLVNPSLHEPAIESMIGGFSCHKLSVNRDTKNPKKRAARSQNCLRPPTKTKSTWESKREIFQKSHVPSPVLSQTNRRNIWVVRPSGFVMESTAKDFGAKISEPWGKDGKGLSKTGCN